MMFKVSDSVLTDTAMQSLSPLQANCLVNDTLVKVVPFLNQSLFHMINVTDPAFANRMSVHQSICHTGKSRLNGLRYQNTFHIMR